MPSMIPIFLFSPNARPCRHEGMIESVSEDRRATTEGKIKGFPYG